MFTSLSRDDWAEIRNGLLKDIKEDLEVLESGAMLICIDDDSPSSRKECAELFWHGGKDFGMNRWFDKSLQFICTTNGKAGLIGEHSMMDGMPTFKTYVDSFIIRLTRTIFMNKNLFLKAQLFH